MSDDHALRLKEAPSTPTMRELAIILFRQRIVFLFVFALAFIATMVYIVSGSRYQAHMKILVRRGRVDTPITGQENAPVDLSRLSVTEEDLNSEVELLKDAEVLRTVAADAGLANRGWLSFLHGYEAPAAREERAARRLGDRLKIEPIKKTNLIAVSYASQDPALASKVLNDLGTLYLQKHMEVHRPPGEVPFFAQQISEARAQLEKADQQVSTFSQRNRVVVAERERDLALEKLSEMDAADRQTKIEIAEIRKRIRELELQTASLPKRSTTQVRNADNPELLKQIKSTLLDLELKRTQLLDKFEPAHRLVQEVEQQIAQTKSAIAAETLTPIHDETTDNDPNYEWAKAELQHAHVQLQALEQRSASLDEQLVAYRNLAQHLGEEAITQDDLQESRKAAQANYLLYLKKLQEARIDDAMDERGIVNVAVAERPVTPALPSLSSAVLLILGIVGATASAAGAAFAVDYLDPAIRTPEEAVVCLNTPVLASLPRKRNVIPLNSWKEIS